MLINSQQMSHDSYKAALASDWLAFFSCMARMKKMPRMGDGRKALHVMTRAEVHSEQEPPVPADPSVAEVETPPTQSELGKRIEEAEKMREVGGCQSHCQPNSWSRWQWRLGHLCQVGRSHPKGNSDQL